VCDRPVANDPPDALSINLSVRARTGNLEAATLKSISALSFIRSAPPFSRMSTNGVKAAKAVL